jgi:hypothetical protein
MEQCLDLGYGIFYRTEQNRTEIRAIVVERRGGVSSLTCCCWGFSRQKFYAK